MNPGFHDFLSSQPFPGGMYLGCNPPFSEFVGRPREEIIGRTDHDLFGKEIADFFREHDQRMLESRSSRHNDEWIAYPDGRKKLIDTLKTPYWGPDGGLIGVVGISRDITAQRQAQEALDIERRRLVSILEGTNVGTWEWNVQTGETIFNGRWAEMVGYTLDELAPVSIGTWVRFAHPDDLGASQAVLEKHFSRELPYYECESRMRHKDGSWIWVLDRGRVSSWTEDGKPLLMSGTHQDITKRKRAEEQLEQLNRTLQQRVDDAVAELRDKDQVLIHQGRLAAMGEMIGNIAHQWRQPLNALSMLISNLHFAQRDHELTEAYMGESVAAANRLIQKMSTTINDFRNFFSPDKEMVDFSVLQQIKQAVQLVDAAFKNSNIEIVIDETIDCTLTGYPNEYSQVLLNLLTNAREAITETGSLPGLIRISVMGRDGMGAVAVRDNGGGIPEHILGRIFEPYFTTKNKGTGIGLYMSKMIIERNMNGLISACNVAGGSEFSVSIPLAGKTA